MSINAFFPFSSDYIRVKTFFLTFAIPELHPGLYAGPSYMRVFTVLRAFFFFFFFENQTARLQLHAEPQRRGRHVYCGKRAC